MNNLFSNYVDDKINPQGRVPEKIVDRQGDMRVEITHKRTKSAARGTKKGKTGLSASHSRFLSPQNQQWAEDHTRPPMINQLVNGMDSQYAA